MVNPLATFIGWSIVPGIATRFLQSVYYGITIRAGDPKPQPGSAVYAKHYRRIRIALIVAYLLYTFYEASLLVRQRGDFYQLLGVPLDVDERGIKSRFRRLAATFHPDKVDSGVNSEASHEFFVLLKTAHETLSKPAQRFAYDRFGPDILRWQHCSTIGDYLAAGLQAYAPMYIGSGVVLVILGVTGWLQWGKFWRYYLTASLIVLEIYTVTRPYSPWILQNFMNPVFTKLTSHPPLLQFQFLELARNFMFTTFMGLSQLGPLLAQPSEQISPNEIPLAQLNYLAQLVSTTEVEISRLLGVEMAPYAGDGGRTQDLQTRIREWLVQNTMRSHSLVKSSLEAAARRRKGVDETVMESIVDE